LPKKKGACVPGPPKRGSPAKRKKGGGQPYALKKSETREKETTQHRGRGR